MIPSKSGMGFHTNGGDGGTVGELGITVLAWTD